VNFISILVQTAVLVLFGVLFYFIDHEHYIYYAVILFFAVFSVLRFGIPRFHRKGIFHVRRKQFEQAVPLFEKSFRFFSRHQWLDKYRVFFLLSSSRISYREMALLNKAFCLSQTGKKSEAIACYKEALKAFPDSQMASAALKMME
jgi:tetratricopeptide (TPR) repeat protein